MDLSSVLPLVCAFLPRRNLVIYCNRGKLISSPEATFRITGWVKVVSASDSSAAGQPLGASGFSHSYEVNHIFLRVRVSEWKRSRRQEILT